MIPRYVVLGSASLPRGSHPALLLEVALLRCQGKEVLERWCRLIRPPEPLPLWASLLTEVPLEPLDRAPSLEEVAEEVSVLAQGAPLVLLEGEPSLEPLLPALVSVYPVAELAAILCPGLAQRDLSSLAPYFGLPPPSGRALPRAESLHQVFLRLLAQAEALGPFFWREALRLLAGRPWPLAALFRALGESSAQGKAASAEAPASVQEGTALEALLARPCPEVAKGPARGQRRWRPEEVAALFREEGPFASSLPAYDYRPEQETMARAIAEALEGEEHLLVEAGTGVGKSLAYLTPVLLHAISQQRRVVVSTNTINLQEQLREKDLPVLRQALEGEGILIGESTVVQIKGRSHYLCLRRLGLFLNHEGLAEDEARLLLKLLVWLGQTQTGDRAEVHLEEQEHSLWHRVSAEADNCLALECGPVRRGTCFVLRLRQRAEEAKLLLVNHALLLADLAASRQILPDYQSLIIDEAHHLEEEATRQFGFRISLGRLGAFLDRLAEAAATPRPQGLLRELPHHFRASTVAVSRQREILELARGMVPQVEEGRHQAHYLFRTLGDLFPSPEAAESEPALRFTPALQTKPSWRAVALAAENLGGALQGLERGLARLQRALEGLEQQRILGYEDLLGEISGASHQGLELRRHLEEALRLDPALIVWLAWGPGSEGLALCAAPQEVAPILEREVFGRLPSVVLTSATLSAGGHFQFLRQRLGVAQARELCLPAPFDYRRAALVLLPTDLAEPTHPAYEGMLHESLLALAEAAGGRTLVLFTSHAALRSAYAALKERCPEQGLSLLGQGLDGTPAALLERFRAQPQALLLGTSSFWEGIDVVGEALSLLVMARLPFAVPTDPLFSARAEAFANPFVDYALPQAVLRFRQGFGRLIRSPSDRGVMVVLDRRVLSRRYGRAFLEALSPCTVLPTSLRELPQKVEAWLEGGLAAFADVL